MDSKKTKELRDGVMRVVSWLDNNWHWIHTNDFGDEEKATDAVETYHTVLNTIEMLGGDWQRNEDGKHKVFICGIGGKAETE
jgi:hypothetical protein